MSCFTFFQDKNHTEFSLLLNLTFMSSSRLSFLQSLLEPESLRQDWLELALTHDAPQRCDTLTPDGQPRFVQLEP